MAPNDFPMMGIDDLGAFQQAAAQNNFLSNLGPAINGARFDMRYWSPGAQLAGSAGQAFLGAILGQIGRAQVADQVSRVSSILPDLYRDPGRVTMPEGMDESAFEQLRMRAGLKKLQQESYRQQMLQELGLDLLKSAEMEKYKADAGATAAGVTERNKILGAQSAWKDIAAAGQADGLDAETQPSYHPDDPRNKMRQDQFALASALRKELSNRDEFAKFGEVQDRFNVLKSALFDTSRISDQDFVVGIAKILDPGSVVRESEGQVVIDSQSIPQSILGQLNAAVGGKQALDPVMRTSLLQLAGRHHDTLKSKTDLLRDQYSTLARKNQIDPLDILPPLVAGPTFDDAKITELATRFPPTPEGRAAFKMATQLLGR